MMFGGSVRRWLDGKMLGRRVGSFDVSVARCKILTPWSVVMIVGSFDVCLIGFWFGPVDVEVGGVKVSLNPDENDGKNGWEARIVRSDAACIITECGRRRRAGQRWGRYAGRRERESIADFVSSAGA